MLQPPETFQQLRALPWSATILIGALWAGLAWALGWRAGAAPLIIGLGAALFSGLAALAAVWASTFGVRHNRVTALWLFIGLCLPLACLLVPAVAPIASHGWLPVGVAGLVQMLALAIGYQIHRTQAQISSDASRLDWPGRTRIDLRHQTIAKVDDEPAAGATQRPWLAPSVIGGLSVVAFQLLQRSLAADSVALLGLVVANALAAWLALGPVARALAQASRLAQLEMDAPRRFTTARLAWLSRERQKTGFGRWVHDRLQQARQPQ